MLVKSDGQVRAGWALEHRKTKAIDLASVDESETSVRHYHRELRARFPEREHHEVVPVLITVKRA